MLRYEEWITCYIYPEEFEHLTPLKADAASVQETAGNLDALREKISASRFRGSYDVEVLGDNDGYAIAFPFRTSDEVCVLDVVWYIDNKSGCWQFVGIRYWVGDELVRDVCEEDDDYYIVDAPDTEQAMLGTYVYFADNTMYNLELACAPF